jgi:hypothetical protein
VSQDFVAKPWQDVGYDFVMDNHRVAVWAKPGMGKTGIVYKVLDMLKLAGSKFFPALVIAPKAVCESVWPAEQAKWRQFRDLRVVQILGTAAQRRDALVTPADIYVINFDNVQWLVTYLGAKWPFKIVIVDEATKLKGYRTKQGGMRARALAQVAKSTGRFIELTGTPSPNGLKDLWGQIWFLDFGHRLGTSYEAFFKRWFILEAYTNQVIPRPNAEAEIYAAIADITLALRPEDWFDVKKPLYSVVECELPPEARKLYDTMEEDFFLQIGEREVTAPIAMTLTTKLLQISGGAVLDTEHDWHAIHDAKLDLLESLYNELGGENILVVYHYKHEAIRMLERFPKWRVYKSKADEADWNANKVPGMLLQAQSASHGLNLQYGGRAIAFYTQTWNAELREQVMERIGPMRQAQAGLDRTVLVYDLIAKRTMDVEVLERVNGKLTVQDALMLARARRSEFADLLTA